MKNVLNLLVIPVFLFCSFQKEKMINSGLKQNLYLL